LADGPLRSVGQYPGVNNVAGIPQSQYSERLLIGYRWYNAKRIVPLFPFGFGLSYTAFRFSGLTVQRDATGATATFRVTNTGSRSGAEVAQVYLSFPTTAGEPPVQLRAFTRLQLAAGQTRTTSLRLDRRAFSIWTRAGWRVRPGCYTIRVGDSSANLPLRARIGRAGGTCRA
ncbi:MAG TPA: fibronectin type III-like domain-contianing protein, partial [Marmoricola sp.]|nr:fibronectin type III-like domain-contianing protein [Marmoricola sp.]